MGQIPLIPVNESNIGQIQWEKKMHNCFPILHYNEACTVNSKSAESSGSQGVSGWSPGSRGSLPGNRELLQINRNFPFLLIKTFGTFGTRKCYFAKCTCLTFTHRALENSGLDKGAADQKSL